jgi:hypothetical protein
VNFISVKTGHNRRVEWVLGALTVVAVVLTAQGHRRFSVVAEDVGVVGLSVLAVVFVVMAWWRGVRGWRDREVSRWRVWISLAGCIAFSLAFAMPWMSMFFFVGPGFMRWDIRTLWIASSLITVFAGVVGARVTRFPLVVGGLMMTCFVLMIPVAVL